MDKCIHIEANIDGHIYNEWRSRKRIYKHVSVREIKGHLDYVMVTSNLFKSMQIKTSTFQMVMMNRLKMAVVQSLYILGVLLYPRHIFIISSLKQKKQLD